MTDQRLTDIFNDTVARLRDEYPRLQKTHYINIAELTPDHDLAPLNPESVFEAQEKKTGFFTIINDESFVTAYGGHGAASFIGDDIDVGERLELTLHHETGHALSLPNGLTLHTNENIADAYAVLQHYRRHGLDSKLPERLMLARAANMVFSPDNYGFSHFTAPTLEKLIKSKERYLRQSQTPANMLQTALELGLEYSLKTDELSFLKKSFNTIHAEIGEDLVGGLRKAAARTTSVAVEKWTRTALRDFNDSAAIPSYAKTAILRNNRIKSDAAIIDLAFAR